MGLKPKLTICTKSLLTRFILFDIIYSIMQETTFMATMTKPGLPPTHTVKYGSMDLGFRNGRINHVEGVIFQPPIHDNALLGKIVSCLDWVSLEPYELPAHVAIGGIASFLPVSGHGDAGRSDRYIAVARHSPESKGVQEDVAKIINEYPNEDFRAVTLQ